MSELRDPSGTSYQLTGDPDSKPMVVLIHGVGLSRAMWLPWLPNLSTEYSVLIYDLYGHGGSHNPPGNRSMADFVAQLNNLTDHVGVERFSLVGFSLGGLISQAFASRHSERLSHLVLLHSVYRRTDEQCAAVRERYRITRDEGPMATVELALKRWFSEPYRRDNPEQMDRIREIFSRHTDDGYLKAYHLFCHAEPEMKDYTLEGIACPSLVITGSAELGSTPAMSEALVRDLTNSELIINPGHLHMAPSEHADTLSNQVLSFLNNHPIT